MKNKNTLRSNISRRITNYFLKGLLLLAPISVTLYVVVRLLIFVDNIIPLDFPVLGLIVVFAAITLFGVLGSFLIQTRLSRFFNRLIDRIPLVKILYSALQDLMSAFMGQKRKFNRPVMVIMSRENNIRKLGFITEDDLSSIGISEGMVAVYLPHSYNFSGNLFIVPLENVEIIDAPATEVMKFIVSGGITRVD
jgi:uncharacterized membrane protein